MKKKVFFGLAVLLVAIIAVLNVFLVQQKEVILSNVAMENVEVLAQEVGGSSQCDDTPLIFCMIVPPDYMHALTGIRY